MARVAGFLKVRGRNKVSPSLRGHLEGREDSRPDHALKRPGMARAIDLGAEPERAAQVTAECLANRGRGRPPLERTEALFAGPPAFHEKTAWPLDRVVAWSHASVRWLQSKLPPGTPLEVASVHLDETSPHVHVAWPTVAPKADGTRRLSWKSQQEYMATKAAGRHLRSPKAQMEALQDSYYREVSKPFGLERGKAGAGIIYNPTADSAKGARARAEAAEAAVVEERQNREAAEAAAAEAAADRRRTAERLEAEQAKRAAADRRADQANTDVADARQQLKDERGAHTATRHRLADVHRRFDAECIDHASRFDAECIDHATTRNRLEGMAMDHADERRAADAAAHCTTQRRRTVEAREARTQRRAPAPDMHRAGQTAHHRARETERRRQR